MIYECEYLSGDGTWHYHGEWELRETNAYYIFTTQDEDYEIRNNLSLKLVKDKGKTAGNPFEIDDDEFVVYPGQAGTPYYFKLKGTNENLCKP